MNLKLQKTIERITAQSFNLKYKGYRTYVHGTDIFNELTSYFDSIKNIELKINKIIENQITIKPINDSNIDKDRFRGAFSFEYMDVRVSLGLFETNNKVVENYPYQENELVSNALIEDKISILPKTDRYTFIERVVALNKLHLSNYFQDKSLKWYFTQIVISEIPRSDSEIKLTIDKILGTKLILSKINYDGIEIGKIGFTGVES